jgi:hypothetical protein
MIKSTSVNVVPAKQLQFSMFLLPGSDSEFTGQATPVVASTSS